MRTGDPIDGGRRRHELLERWLRAEPHDPHERGHAAAMRALLAADADPFRRTRFEPGHFTASAFVLAPQGDELALIFHDALERWLQPGGHVEAGDVDLIEAARREAREELGIEQLTLIGSAPLDLDVHTIPARRSEPEHRHFDVRFLFRAATRELSAGEGVREACWVRPARVSLDGDASMRRVLAKL